MSVLRAPRLTVSWTATSLGAAFGGYKVYGRPSRSAAIPWYLAASITVPTGYSAATVEAQHNRFYDYEAGWAVTGGQWQDGWDYAVTVTSLTTGIESVIATVSGLNVNAADGNPWVVSNAAPWLNFPLSGAATLKGSGRANVRRYTAAGRDMAITRTPLELPERTYDLTAHLLAKTGEDQLRPWRAAAASGRAMSLMLPWGDRAIGAVDNPSDVPYGVLGYFDASGQFVESTRTPVTAGYNGPAGIVLNGTSQYVTVPDNTLINPASGAFTIVLCAVFPNPAAVNVYMSKGSQSAGQFYGLMHDNATSINNMRGKIVGASATATLNHNSATWFDGVAHCAILTSTGTAQALYQDDTLTPVATGATATGAVSNAVALTIGANNGGADGRAALAPLYVAACYSRALTAAEAQRTARYVLGYPGYRMAANPAFLVDTRDDRTWAGYGSNLVDISAVPPVLAGTLVAAPATRGIPAPLSTLDRFS